VGRQRVSALRPGQRGPRQALAEALGRESFGGEPLARSFFDLQPKTYQQDMLEQLAAGERAHGRWRNLVVAATGTGKTVVAAFDYRRICRSEGGRPRLLFVAHREEILRQALRTYREVLRDPEFGELLAGGVEPKAGPPVRHHRQRDQPRSAGHRGADHWHTVVVDECHRLAADRFHAFVTQVRPSVCCWA
jgi:superfamily II DNA or RNA helicase